MSRERGVMSSEEADHVSPWEVTPTVGKGTLGTCRFPTSAWVAGLIKPVQSPDAVLETRLWANHGVRVNANQRLSLGEEGKALWRKSQDFKPDRGNPAVRHYRGATGNVAMVGMRTRLAIERAGTVTPHLKRGAPVLYPNPRGNREQTDRQNLRSAAPVLDPTKAGFPLSHRHDFSCPKEKHPGRGAGFALRPAACAPRRLRVKR